MASLRDIYAAALDKLHAWTAPINKGISDPSKKLDFKATQQGNTQDAEASAKDIEGGVH